MEETELKLRQCIDQLCENGGNEAELMQMLQNFPADATSCPVDLVKKLVKLVENYSSLRSHLNQMNNKVEKLGKSTGELEMKAKQWEKAHQVVMKERDRLQADLNKQILCKDRLENLCRELQRDKKKMEDDCNTRIRAEEAKRKEFADRVSDSINQLKQQISSNQEQQQQLCEENIQLTDKLEKSLELTKHHERALEKYEEREKTFNQLIVAKDDEKRILSQKYENAVRLMQEIHKNEIDKFKVQIDELLAQRKVVEDSFVEQSKSYDSKFAQMGVLVTESQNTITKYKKEMGEITKFIQKLHAESLKSKETIQHLTMEKSQLQQSTDSLKKKMKALESLCRRLQGDRRSLVSLCKGNGLADEVEKALATVENEAPAEVEEQPPAIAKSPSSVSSDGHEAVGTSTPPSSNSEQGDEAIILQAKLSALNNESSPPPDVTSNLPESGETVECDKVEDSSNGNIPPDFLPAPEVENGA